MMGSLGIPFRTRPDVVHQEGKTALAALSRKEVAEAVTASKRLEALMEGEDG